MNIIQLVTASPAEIDAHLVEVGYAIGRLASEVDRNLCTTRRKYATDAQRAEAAQAMAAAKAKLVAQQAVLYHLDREYERRGAWTRVWVVPGGHAHRSQSCHSLYAGTQLVLYPALSGATEEEIVAAAGDRACTFCYPSAPVEKKSSIVLDSEKAADAARTEREQAKAKRAADKQAKAITHPDGSRIRHDGWYIDTEAEARRRYIEAYADALWGAYGRPPQPLTVRQEDVEPLLVALAAKHGKTVEEMRAELEPKIVAKAKRDQVAATKHARSLGLIK